MRFVAPPLDLPPVAKLLAQVEELEQAMLDDRHPEERAQRASKGDGQSSPPSFEGGLRPPPQDDGEGQERKENIERFVAVVMAHLDEFEAMRRNGKLLAKQHLATARAISILTDAFNKLQRTRAALSGSTHDSAYANADMPTDPDAFRDELARRIRAFVASRTGPRDADGNSGPAVVDEVG